MKMKTIILAILGVISLRATAEDSLLPEESILEELDRRQISEKTDKNDKCKRICFTVGELVEGCEKSTHTVYISGGIFRTEALKRHVKKTEDISTGLADCLSNIPRHSNQDGSSEKENTQRD